MARVKDLGQLRLLLAQDEDGLRKYVYPKLRLGDVWWIADHVSGFGERGRHPWAIVRGYDTITVGVVACPRTTKISSARRGIVTPAGILPGLDQDGFIVLKHRQLFLAKDFRSFDYVGRLSERCIGKIQNFYRVMAEGKMVT